MERTRKSGKKKKKDRKYNISGITDNISDNHFILIFGVLNNTRPKKKIICINFF